jgi:hypothetical protein
MLRLGDSPPSTTVLQFEAWRRSPACSVATFAKPRIRHSTGAFSFCSTGIIRACGRPELLIIPEVDLSVPRVDAKAANGYSALYAPWKADEEAHNQSAQERR